MDFNNLTDSHQVRIFLTREALAVDMFSDFESVTLAKLIKASVSLLKLISIEKAMVSSEVVKELINEDIATLMDNMGVLNSAIRMNAYKFEYGLCMN